MERLSDELWFGILAYVPPLDLMCATHCVSKRWAALIASDAFWRNHPLIVGGDDVPPPPTSSSGTTKTTTTTTTASNQKTPRLSLNTHQLQRICLYKATEKAPNVVSSGDGPQLSTSLHPRPVFPSFLEARQVENDSSRRICCTAATTDHVSERLINVLRSDESTTGIGYHYNNNQHDPDHDFDENRLNDYMNNNNNANPPTWRRRSRWWSSSLTRTPYSTETLMFVTRFPLVLLTRLKIKPRADPQDHRICYTWKQTVIRAYRLPLQQLTDPNRMDGLNGVPCSFGMASSTSTTNGDNHHRNHQIYGNVDALGALNNYFFRFVPARAEPDHATIDLTLQGHEPVFESEPFAVPPDRNDVYEFTFPMSNWKDDCGGGGGSIGIVANLITIDLIGKNKEQFSGQGYYTCVEMVDAIGIPLLSEPIQEMWL